MTRVVNAHQSRTFDPCVKNLGACEQCSSDCMTPRMKRDITVPRNHAISKELPVTHGPVTSSRGLALACADFLWRQDEALRSLGLEQLSIDAGEAMVAMTVLPEMVNGLGITHGGAIFKLADA